MVTIADVAAHAGVGAGTVSRVLNDSPRVSDSTRARVLAAIDELDYRPNPLARGLSPGPVPDPGRRRPVLHARLGRRAPPGRRRGPRRQPVRPRAVQRRVAGAPRRALRHAHAARPGRRPRRHVAAAAPVEPRAAGRRRRCPSCCSTPTVPACRRSSPTTSRAVASPPATCSSSATERIAFIGDDPDNPLGFTSSDRPRAGLPRDDGRRRPRRSTPARAPRPPRARRRPPSSPSELLSHPDRPTAIFAASDVAGPRACSRRRGPPASTSPATCRSSASTTSRSRATPASRRSGSPCSRAGSSAPACCSRRSPRKEPPGAERPRAPARARRAVDDRTAGLTGPRRVTCPAPQSPTTNPSIQRGQTMQRRDIRDGESPSPLAWRSRLAASACARRRRRRLDRQRQRQRLERGDLDGTTVTIFGPEVEDEAQGLRTPSTSSPRRPASPSSTRVTAASRQQIGVAGRRRQPARHRHVPAAGQDQRLREDDLSPLPDDIVPTVEANFDPGFADLVTIDGRDVRRSRPRPTSRASSGTARPSSRRTATRSPRRWTTARRARRRDDRRRQDAVLRRHRQRRRHRLAVHRLGRGLHAARCTGPTCTTSGSTTRSRSTTPQVVEVGQHVYDLWSQGGHRVRRRRERRRHAVRRRRPAAARGRLR